MMLAACLGGCDLLEPLVEEKPDARPRLSIRDAAVEAEPDAPPAAEY